MYCNDKSKLVCVSLRCCRYVWENIEVGYVQGMCDLAAPLLVIFDDGESTSSQHVTKPLQTSNDSDSLDIIKVQVQVQVQ